MHSNSSFLSKAWEGKEREKSKWKIKAGTLCGLYRSTCYREHFLLPCYRGSHLPCIRSSQILISHGLSYCGFLCSIPNDLLCSKVSSWDGRKESLTLPKHVDNSLCSQLIRACCRLHHHLFYRRVLWFTTPKGQQISQRSQVLIVIMLISLEGSSQGQDAIAKSSVKLLTQPKPKTLNRLNSLTEVQRSKGRTLAPEQITQLSACKYLQNSIHSSETLCTSEAAGRQQWKQNTHRSDFKISTSNNFLQWIRSINEVLLSYQS